MNVQQLIDELQNIKDKSLPIAVYNTRGMLQLRDLKITKDELWIAIVIEREYPQKIMTKKEAGSMT